ncbi:MAG: hypothetical protein V8S34_03240 [Lawsonibacter sp.]
MAIVKMDHVRLIAMTEDREEILRRLQRLGCVEIDQASVEGSPSPGRLRRRRRTVSAFCGSSSAARTPSG